MAASANRYHQEFGTPKERTAAKVRDHMLPWLQEFIAHAPFAVLSTSDAAGRCDASPKGGRPGFVKVLDDRHLLVPDVAGNKLFQSYGNLDENPHVALLFMIPGVGETVRVNGRAERLDGPALAARQIELNVHDPDDKAVQLQGLLVEVEEAYGHCPRAFVFSRLWDPDTIAAHRAERPISRKPPGV